METVGYYVLWNENAYIFPRKYGYRSLSNKRQTLSRQKKTVHHHRNPVPTEISDNKCKSEPY